MIGDIKTYRNMAFTNYTWVLMLMGRKLRVVPVKTFTKSGTSSTKEPLDNIWNMRCDMSFEYMTRS